MCLATAYVVSETGDNIFLENVISVEIQGGAIKLTDILNRQKCIMGNIIKIDYINANIILEGER